MAGRTRCVFPALAAIVLLTVFAPAGAAAAGGLPAVAGGWSADTSSYIGTSTDMELHGEQRLATVNGGSFLGVPIGTFTATAGTGGALDAVIRASGLGTAHVRLLDFTAAPPTA